MNHSTNPALNIEILNTIFLTKMYSYCLLLVENLKTVSSAIQLGTFAVLYPDLNAVRNLNATFRIIVNSLKHSQYFKQDKLLIWILVYN